MRYILTAEQMKASDMATICEIGIPSLVLMERAALRCVEVMKEEQIDLTKPLIVCGSGNNGGDGVAVARLLFEEGYTPEVVFVGNMSSRSQEMRAQMEILEKLGVSFGNSLPDREYSVIIDAVFGIGLSRIIEGRYREIIEQMNRYKGAKVAIDIASGISADTGQILGCAFRADLTVTFAYGKAGQYFYPGCDYSGRTVVRPIGIRNQALELSDEVYCSLERADLRRQMPVRPADSHKGTFGRVLMITGSKGMSGAAYLAAKAAYLTGAGLVQIYTEESNRQILQAFAGSGAHHI
ncbi:NAD(P)H-hydrate epimerase [Roseburia hominis]